MCPSLIEIGSKMAEKNSAQTDRQTDTTKIMVTWPWTNEKMKTDLEQFTEGCHVRPRLICRGRTVAVAGLWLAGTQRRPRLWRRRWLRYDDLWRQNSVGRLPGHRQRLTVVYGTVGHRLDSREQKSQHTTLIGLILHNCSQETWPQLPTATKWIHFTQEQFH